VEWALYSDQTVDDREETRFSSTHPQVWSYLEKHFQRVPSYRLPRRVWLMQRRGPFAPAALTGPAGRVRYTARYEPSCRDRSPEPSSPTWTHFSRPRRGATMAPNGLQVEGRDEIRKVVTGVSACGELFRRAREAQADAILVHHGLFWEGMPRVLTGFQ